MFRAVVAAAAIATAMPIAAKAQSCIVVYPYPPRDAYEYHQREEWHRQCLHEQARVQRQAEEEALMHKRLNDHYAHEAQREEERQQDEENAEAIDRDRRVYGIQPDAYVTSKTPSDNSSVMDVYHPGLHYLMPDPTHQSYAPNLVRPLFTRDNPPVCFDPYHLNNLMHAIMQNVSTNVYGCAAHIDADRPAMVLNEMQDDSWLMPALHVLLTGHSGKKMEVWMPAYGLRN